MSDATSGTLSTSNLPLNLSWDSISVNTIEQRKKEQCQQEVVLDKASGCARAGRLLVLFGPSGSGKTTLLTILSGRALSPQLQLDSSCNIYLNGQKITDRQVLLKYCGFLDSPTTSGIIGTLITVREHLTFQAMLRMPSSISDFNRHAIVTTLLKRFRLNLCADTPVARISGGEAKRVSLAQCLLTDPPIVLFDDCNAGLDSNLALSIMKHVRTLGKTTIVVLHQPSRRIMDLIDDICLLDGAHTTIYAGPYNRLLSVFYAPCPDNMEPTDFFLEQLTITGKEKVSQVQCADILQEQMAVIERDQFSTVSETFNDSPNLYASSLARQIRWLLWRSVSRRQMAQLFGIFVKSFLIAILYGITMLQQGTKLDQPSIDGEVGFLLRTQAFVSRVYSSLLMAQIPIDFIVLERESNEQRLYSVSAYYISKVIVETPIVILMSWIYTTISAILIYQRNYFALCATMALTTVNGVAFGYLLSALLRSKETRLIMWQPIASMMANFSGFYINTRSIPLILKPLQYLSISYYSWHILVITQYADIKYIDCDSNGKNNNSIGGCFRNGNDILHKYAIDSHPSSFYVWTFISLTFVLHLLSYTILYVRTRRK